MRVTGSYRRLIRRCMEEADSLSKVFVHRQGVRLVSQWLQKCGLRLESLATDIRYDPQIVARRDGRLIHIAVRTVILPDLGELECPELHEELVDWARQHHAICLLARVGIKPAATAEDTTQHRIVFEELWLPDGIDGIGLRDYQPDASET